MSRYVQIGSEVDQLTHTAKLICERRGYRFTHLRAHVFRIVAMAGKPIGAYTIMNQLGEALDREQVAPPTVYRTLEFLVNAEVVHRVHSLNAYIPNRISDKNKVAALFICRQCGYNSEAPSSAVQQSLNLVANELKFEIGEQSIEVLGRCEHCMKQNVKTNER